ncbi:hypothetical protein ILYODFUR_032721 [Ilyodon furcidens]|uniref:Uncharacterized protein n=1 Tax=Ilyodon furcidens TaxID=33524 RepID=A0ABV0U1H9_9TELE
MGSADGLLRGATLGGSMLAKGPRLSAGFSTAWSRASNFDTLASKATKNATFITRTIITKGGRGLTEHLTDRAGERRNSITGSHDGAKANTKLATPSDYKKNRVKHGGSPNVKCSNRKCF